MPDDAVASAPEALWLSLEAGNAEWTFAEPAPVWHLAELFRRHYGIEARRGRRIFFSRGASKIRRLVNEDALWAIAKLHGFERFEARADNHAEQVRSFFRPTSSSACMARGWATLPSAGPGPR